MSKPTMLLNHFPVELLPLNYNLPSAVYDSWEASTEGLNRDYGRFSWYRVKESNDTVRALILNGPERPENLKNFEVDAADLPDFGKAIISRSIAHYFAARGLTVQRNKFETVLLRKTPAHSQGFIDVFCGVAVQVRRPFIQSPDSFVMSAQWEVQTNFNKSLSDPELRGIADGMSVLYRPTPNAEVPKELRRYVNRYLGRVQRVQSQTEALVDCKDHVLKCLPLADLFLEASPEAIRDYERKTGAKQASRSLWYKLQEASFVLNSQGRRNPSVLKDRMQAIRTFLGGNAKERLIIPVACFQEGSVVIDLNPIRVEVS